MTTDLTTTTTHSDTEKIALLKRTLCRGATDDELHLFFGVCQRTGLDPFAKQVYAIRRRQQIDGHWVDKLETQVSIDGLRLIAQRGGHDGMEGPLWCGDDGIWHDVWIAKMPPVAAKVTVYRKGSTRGFPAVARWDSYAQTGRDGQPTRFWAKMADLMLGKVAEALALRRAFPAELSGLYTPEEMDQATTVKATPALPPEEHTPIPHLEPTDLDAAKDQARAAMRRAMPGVSGAVQRKWMESTLCKVLDGTALTVEDFQALTDAANAMTLAAEDRP